mmetsp:Transcript_15640/g.47660  ORF Transcript_15640/g.47660 Transcript_15640/m.47660 type:complete len:218 (-) Transcript_15640:455-1108(-)
MRCAVTHTPSWMTPSKLSPCAWERSSRRSPSRTKRSTGRGRTWLPWTTAASGASASWREGPRGTAHKRVSWKAMGPARERAPTKRTSSCRRRRRRSPGSTMRAPWSLPPPRTLTCWRRRSGRAWAASRARSPSGSCCGSACPTTPPAPWPRTSRTSTAFSRCSRRRRRARCRTLSRASRRRRRAAAWEAGPPRCPATSSGTSARTTSSTCSPAGRAS